MNRAVELMKLWPSDLTIREIGQRIYMAESSVYGLARRIGLPPRKYCNRPRPEAA